jgi:hypothetical protein
MKGQDTNFSTEVRTAIRKMLTFCAGEWSVGWAVSHFL